MRRSFTEVCRLQGLPSDFDLPLLKDSAKKLIVGNGVALPVARAVAKAIREATCKNNSAAESRQNLCGCFCGRRITGKQQFATAACRKRMQVRRERARQKFSPGIITV